MRKPALSIAALAVIGAAGLMPHAAAESVPTLTETTKFASVGVGVSIVRLSQPATLRVSLTTTGDADLTPRQSIATHRDAKIETAAGTGALVIRELASSGFAHAFLQYNADLERCLEPPCEGLEVDAFIRSPVPPLESSGDRRVWPLRAGLYEIGLLTESGHAINATLHLDGAGSPGSLTTVDLEPKPVGSLRSVLHTETFAQAWRGQIDEPFGAGGFAVAVLTRTDQVFVGDVTAGPSIEFCLNGWCRSKAVVVDGGSLSVRGIIQRDDDALSSSRVTWQIDGTSVERRAAVSLLTWWGN